MFLLRIFAQVRRHSHTQKMFSLLGSQFIFQPQTGHLAHKQSDKPSHQDTMSLACPTKRWVPSKLPENSFCKLEVYMKLLVENSISRSVSRQKTLNVLKNEHIQLYLPCIILHKYWIWGFDSAYLWGFDQKKSLSWGKHGRNDMDKTRHLLL